ncbi:unnamed protein product [Mesocestoides corti]|uniref:Rho-GAP domain-containing protein n=1 Tax=Mesocestoides corti TaxID=53468 RepID=A0A158QW91_MESCO|nr:unnamed protein product [Mesocestoides corti]
MPIFQNIRSCVRRKQGVTRRPTKIHFNVRMVDAFKSENVASQLRDLLVYIAREGVAVTDLFRRPGNLQSIKKIIADLESGRPINWTDYNFYTLANIAKRFLLHIEGGILGEEAEEALLKALEIPDIDARNAQMKLIITSQPKTVQQLLTLLFGTWFRMIYHTEVNAMSVEAVAKSVAGSIFPSCTYSPEKVEKASKVMEVLIVGFASTELFGRELIEYFTRETKTSISRVEKFKYEFRFPKNVPKPRSTQMFRQMLIEESKKHGFDILKDEVTREEFELASQPVTYASPQQSTAAAVSAGTESNGPRPAVTPSTPSFRVPLAPLQPTTQSPVPYAPRCLLDETAQGTDEGEDADILIDRVQQYSEKRTCITATSTSVGDPRFRRRDSSGVGEEEEERISSLGCRQYDSLSEIADLPEVQDRSRYTFGLTAALGVISAWRSRVVGFGDDVSGCRDLQKLVLPFSELMCAVRLRSPPRLPVFHSTARQHSAVAVCLLLWQPVPLHGCHRMPLVIDAGHVCNGRSLLTIMQVVEVTLLLNPICEFFVPGSATYGSCFNSVKKKQLERLQKRSDWFLSPPAGLRNSGMMRVDLPTTPGIPRSPQRGFNFVAPRLLLSLTLSRPFVASSRGMRGCDCRCPARDVVSNKHILFAPTEASRNPSKVSKGVNGEEVSRTCGTPEPPAHLRRKPSNRQPQQQNPPADAWATSGPPLYTNSHIPSSSRQFTLASSPYANADASCSARRGADGIADASSANHASEDELVIGDTVLRGSEVLRSRTRVIVTVTQIERRILHAYQERRRYFLLHSREVMTSSHSPRHRRLCTYSSGFKPFRPPVLPAAVAAAIHFCFLGFSVNDFPLLACACDHLDAA